MCMYNGFRVPCVLVFANWVKSWGRWQKRQRFIIKNLVLFWLSCGIVLSACQVGEKRAFLESFCICCHFFLWNNLIKALWNLWITLKWLQKRNKCAVVVSNNAIIRCFLLLSTILSKIPILENFVQFLNTQIWFYLILKRLQCCICCPTSEFQIDQF